MIDAIVYLVQLTVVASFCGITYRLGQRYFGRHARRVLLAGIIAVMSVTALAWLPQYVLLDVPFTVPTALNTVDEFAAGHEQVNSADRVVRKGWMSLASALFVGAVVLVGLAALFRVLSTTSSYLSMRCLIRSAESVSDGELQIAVNDVVKGNESFRSCCRITRVRFVQSDEVATASTFGHRMPVVLLPLHWKNWTGQELRAVLAHEFEHIKHADFLFRLAAELVRALHFYHPLVGWIANQYRIEQENTADLAAAKYLGRELYERLLFAEGTQSAKEQSLRWVPSFSFESKSLLRRRIEMLRERSGKQEQTGSTLSMMVMACVIPLTLVLCGINASAQQDDDSPRNSAEVQEGDDAQDSKNDWIFQFNWGDDLGQEEAPGIRNSFKFFWSFPDGALDEPEEAEDQDTPGLWRTEFRFEWSLPDSGK